MGNIKGRSTVYNNITSEEKLKQVNPENIMLEEDFLDYLQSVDRSPETIKQYKANLHVFWCWNLDNNNNKFFVDLTKREIARFQNHCINTWGYSPKRVRTVKATLSSLANFIENILDSDYPNYRNIINKIESPANEPVREKCVYDENEMQNLLDSLVNMGKYEQACLLALALFSGKRKAELILFKVSYFGDENLICDGALYKSPELIRSKGRGKNGKMIYAYTLAKSFKPYFDLWMQERNDLGINSQWLFPNKNNPDEHISSASVDSWFSSFGKILGSHLNPHACRHWFVTYLSKSGIPDDVIKDLSSWANVSMVDVYRDTNAEDNFEKYFGSEGIKQVEQKGLSDL